MAPIDPQVLAVLETYGIDGALADLRTLVATHRAYRVRVGERSFALRQYNPYTLPADLDAQLLLAQLLQGTPVDTPPPLPATGGKRFVTIEGRLWALFPWAQGRSANEDNPEDHVYLARAAACWVRAMDLACRESSWEKLVRSAAALRRRKEHAWVVPLDRVPQFARETGAIGRMRRVLPGAEHGPYLAAVGEIEASLEEFSTAAEAQRVEKLPRIITHSDLFHANILVQEGGMTIIDLDCFSYEPRPADLVRGLCRLGPAVDANVREGLVGEFQRDAALAKEELAAMSLLAAGYHLYYALIHGLLYLVESRGARESVVERIRSETAACRQALRGCCES